MKLKIHVLGLSLPGLLLAPISQGPEKDPAALGRSLRTAEDSVRASFVETCAAQGIEIDFRAGRLSIPALSQHAEMPIEYLLVGPKGATHETLFVTQAKPSLIVAALFALGLDPGRNVEYRDRAAPPSEAEMAEGALPYEVVLPQGPGAYLYASWKDGAERRQFRIEDLVLNTKTGRTAAPVRWVFLGSRFFKPSVAADPIFAADLEENLVSICFFGTGNQIFTNPDRDGQEQHLFLPNSWLLPPKGTTVKLLFSLEKLEGESLEGR